MYGLFKRQGIVALLVCATHCKCASLYIHHVVDKFVDFNRQTDVAAWAARMGRAIVWYGFSFRLCSGLGIWFMFGHTRFRLVARNIALCCHANGAKHDEQGENDVFWAHDVCEFDLL